MLWLGIHFPRLPLEVFATGDASAGAPAVATVVVEDNRILLRDAAAIDAGIAPGASLATAHSILPGLRHHPRQIERERQRLELVGEALYGFSSRVALSEPVAMRTGAGAMLEIGASLRLFGEAGELARQVAELCRNLGHRVAVRSAATPLAALILARAGAARLEEVPLPLAAVEPGRLAEERIERLANVGVRTLGQLLALPASGVSQRFGSDLTDYLARITGERPDPRHLVRPRQRFHTTAHLLDPVSDKQALGFPIQRLLGDLQHWLVARQLGAEQLRWCFVSGSGRSVSMAVRFARAQQSRAAFLDITRLKLGATDLPGEVITITLEARRLTPWTADNRGLFATGAHDAVVDSAELDALVDQLRARLGSQACFGLAIRDQYTPEEAWQPAAPRSPRPAAKGRRGSMATAVAAKDASKGANAVAGANTNLNADTTAIERPLWLFEPPHPIRREHLALLQGPERIHTGWWLGEGSPDEGSASPGHARDYYVARHRNGARCWVFVDPWERWFLHGYFG